MSFIIAINRARCYKHTLPVEVTKQNDWHRVMSVVYITVRVFYKVAFFSSLVIARLIKSLIVMPADATKAATRECNSDGMRNDDANLPLQ